MESSSPVVCQEVFDENSQPSAEEISDYAYQIGIDPVSESHLLPLAKEGLMQALPEPWKAFYDEKLKAHYYYNSETKQTQWDHPVDNVYKEIVVKARSASEKDNSVHDDTCASVLDILTSEDVSRHHDKSRDESLGADNTFSNRARSAKDEPKPFLLQKRLSDLKMASFGHSMESLSRQQRFPVSFGKPPLAPFHKPALLKQNSEMIDLNINVLSEKDGFGTVNAPMKADRGLPLSGKGLMFLKSRPSDTSLMDAKMTSAINFKEDQRKGILRESEKLEKSSKESFETAKDIEDDKKSVRFNLSSSDCTAEVFHSPSSTSLSENQENLRNFPSNEIVQNLPARNLSGVKLAPISFNPVSTNNSKISRKPVAFETEQNEAENQINAVKRLLKPPAADFIKSELFQKKFEKISDILKPNSGDSDSESEAKPRPRSPLNPPKTKLSINLMESIESETSTDSPDKDIDNIDLNDDFEAASHSKPIIKVNNQSPPNEKHTESYIEATEKKKIKLENLKMSLEDEYSRLEGSLRDEMRERMTNLEEEIKREQDIETDSLRRKLNALHEENRNEIDKAIADVEKQHKENMEQILSKLRTQLESERDAYIANEEERMREETEKIKFELEEKHKETIERLDKEHFENMNKLKLKFEREEAETIRELRETMSEKFESEKSRLTAEHAATVESIRSHHETVCEEIRADYRKEVSVLRSEQCAHLDELRARRRNDQKALQDKYKCLKEKYIRLKADVKMSIERRNKRREQSMTTSAETERSNSHKKAEAERCKETIIAQKMTAVVVDVESDSSKRQSDVKSGGRSNLNVTQERRLDKSPVRKIVLEHSEGARNSSENEMSLGMETSISASESKTASRRNTKPVPRPNCQKPPKPVHRAPMERAQTDYHDSSDAADSLNNKNQENVRSKRKSFSKTKSASTSRLNYTTCADRACSPVENLRQQLKKLEDLEDQFPDLTVDATAYTLRYPFGECGRGTELEFMAHRALVERERLRRARTALAARARHLRRARHQLPGHQEEFELPELEISLHRMRALLGEKVIRLRHIEAALTKLAANRYVAKELSMSELSSSESDAGHMERDAVGNDTFYKQTTELVQNLNSEIQNIWQTIDRQQNHNSVIPSHQLATGPRITQTTQQYQPWPIFITSAPVQHTQENIASHIQSSPDVGIIEKAKELREWLERQSM